MGCSLTVAAASAAGEGCWLGPPWAAHYRVSRPMHTSMQSSQHWQPTPPPLGARGAYLSASRRRAAVCLPHRHLSGGYTQL
jgi:hypothetical protein